MKTKQNTKNVLHTILFVTILILIASVIAIIQNLPIRKLTEKRYDAIADECLLDSGLRNYRFLNTWGCKEVNDDGKLIKDNFIRTNVYGENENKLYGAIATTLYTIDKKYRIPKNIGGIEFVVGVKDKNYLYITRENIKNIDWEKVENDGKSFYNYFTITTN